MVDLLIPGPEGKIEAKYSHNNGSNSPIVLILHPDPSRGGTMNTKIIFRLYKIFVNNHAWFFSGSPIINIKDRNLNAVNLNLYIYN